MSYLVAFRDSLEEFFTDGSAALNRAIVAAIGGEQAAVFDDVGLLWDVEVDTKVDEADPHHPAIVHFRGATLDDAVVDLAPRELNRLRSVPSLVARARSDRT